LLVLRDEGIQTKVRPTQPLIQVTST